MKSNLLAEKTDYHNILHLRTRSTWEVGTVILATKKISPNIFLNLHPDAGGPGRHYVIGVVVMIGDVDKLINGRDAVDICKKDVVHRKIVVAFCRGGTMKSLEKDNAVIDCRPNELRMYFGAGTRIDSLSLSQVLQLEIAISGHLMLPISHFQGAPASQTDTLNLLQTTAMGSDEQASPAEARPEALAPPSH